MTDEPNGRATLRETYQLIQEFRQEVNGRFDSHEVRHRQDKQMTLTTVLAVAALVASVVGSLIPRLLS